MSCSCYWYLKKIVKVPLQKCCFYHLIADIGMRLAGKGKPVLLVLGSPFSQSSQLKGTKMEANVTILEAVGMEVNTTE